VRHGIFRPSDRPIPGGHLAKEITMKKILSGVLALSVAASAVALSAGAASAQPRDRDHDGRPGVQSGFNGPARWNAPKRFKVGRYAPPKGYRAHNWTRGERLPTAYRGRTYVVDHRRYGLAAPPRGYEYVRVGNDVVLTAIATGVIASVVANLFN
jgi:Ni/Co efflux regulator RcnB